MEAVQAGVKVALDEPKPEIRRSADIIAKLTGALASSTLLSKDQLKRRRRQERKAESMPNLQNLPIRQRILSAKAHEVSNDKRPSKEGKGVQPRKLEQALKSKRLRCCESFRGRGRIRKRTTG